VIPGVSGQDTTGLDKHVFFESEELVYTNGNMEPGMISFEIETPREFSCRCWKTSREGLNVEKEMMIASMKTPFEDLSRVNVIYEVSVIGTKPGFLKPKGVLTIDIPFGVNPASRDTFDRLTEITNEVTSQAKLKHAKDELPSYVFCHVTAPPILTPPHFTLPWVLTLSSPIDNLEVTSSIYRKSSTRAANKPGKYHSLTEGFVEQSTYDICKSTKPVKTYMEGDKLKVEGEVFVLTNTAITVRGCAVNVEHFLHVTLNSPSFSKGIHIVELPIFVPSIGYFTDSPPAFSDDGVTYFANGVVHPNGTNGNGTNGINGMNGHSKRGTNMSELLPGYDFENGLDVEEKKE